MAIYTYGFSLISYLEDGLGYVNLNPSVVSATHVSVLKVIPLSVSLERTRRVRTLLIV